MRLITINNAESRPGEQADGLFGPAAAGVYGGMALQAGSRLGDYVVDELIGRGHTGELYRARDVRRNRLVALKLLTPDLAADRERFARFDREARTGALVNHPNIVAVLDAGSDDGRPFLVTELLHGTTLRGRMAGPLATGLAVRYARQIAAGLAAAHELGVVHRNVKPENVFVTYDDRVKILDFGLAQIPARHADPRMVLGSIWYMSPEQICGDPVDHRTDIFSLGVILFEMVTGELPYRTDSAKQRLECARARQSHQVTEGPGVGPDLERVIRHCIAKDPDYRYQSARDLLFGLELVDEEPRAPVVRPASSKGWLPFNMMWLS